ncbi:hypothetical protein [Rathayibacter sp. VKM Ac-2630]|nr:hypothetical protein [Rathayibacter sp. VKM Ac-2630]
MPRTRSRAASAAGATIAVVIITLAGVLVSSVLVLGIVSVWRLIAGV